jgi:hypothetical protein
MFKKSVDTVPLSSKHGNSFLHQRLVSNDIILSAKDLINCIIKKGRKNKTHSYICLMCVGDFVVNSPMVLGHEASGFVAKVGPGVHHLQAGMRRSTIQYLQGRFDKSCTANFVRG